MTTTNDESVTQLPIGVWNVDPASSELGFSARGMFGLVTVHGHFGQFNGTLTIDGEGARGQLTVQTASLDTRNKKRDVHLLSGDFFDVKTHPTLTFELTGVKPVEPGELSISGVLRIRDNSLPITAPVKAATADDRVILETTVDVDRDAAGLGWSKMGMIKGKAHLTAKLTLRRD